MKRILIIMMLSAGPAAAHDIYNGVRSPAGQLCCGGDPITGDCEALESDQVRFNRDGSVSMYSKRYKAWILVSGDVVLPAAIPGDNGAAGHYCGVRRSASVVTPDQPDPGFMTYCAFVRPGGV